MVDVSYLRVFNYRTTGRRIIERYCLIQPLCWRSELIHDENPTGENGWHFVEFIPFERDEIYTAIGSIRHNIDNPPDLVIDHDYPAMKMYVDDGNKQITLGKSLRTKSGPHPSVYFFGIEDDTKEDTEASGYVPMFEELPRDYTAEEQAQEHYEQFGFNKLLPGSISLVASQTLYYLQNGWNLTPVKGTDKNGDDYWWLEDATKNPKRPQVFDILGKNPTKENFKPPFNNGIKMPFDTPYNAPILPTLFLAFHSAVRPNISSRWDLITLPNYRAGHIPDYVLRQLEVNGEKITGRHKVPDFVRRQDRYNHYRYLDREGCYVPFQLPKWTNLNSK